LQERRTHRKHQVGDKRRSSPPLDQSSPPSPSSPSEPEAEKTCGIHLHRWIRRCSSSTPWRHLQWRLERSRRAHRRWRRRRRLLEEQDRSWRCRQQYRGGDARARWRALRRNPLLREREGRGKKREMSEVLRFEKKRATEGELKVISS
jgi:hypothetical protein